MISAHEALGRLREGNRRFVSNAGGADRVLSSVRRAELAQKQEPFAVVLGCSDSRVPPETVFDQGPGTLFVVRVAGNIAAPSQVGSVEFAAERFRTRLVVVLGHTRCGAVQSTFEALQTSIKSQSPNIQEIVNRVRPSVENCVKAESKGDTEDVVAHAVRENIRSTVDELQHKSQVLSQLAVKDGLLVVGAEYCLDTGVVAFFDIDG